MNNKKLIAPLHSLRIAQLRYLLIIFLFACNSNTGVENTVEKNAEPEHANTTTLSGEQMNAIGIQFSTLEKKQLTASMKANGILNVPNQNRATATALMGGVIKSILVQAGNNISKGQTIATISNTSFITMQEEFLSTSAKLEYAETELKRQQELNAGNATALKTLQQIQSEVKTLKARKVSLQKQLELIGIHTASLNADNIQSVISIISPISGAVRDIMVNIGSYVEANNPIAEIIDNSQLHLDLFVYEKDLSKLREGQIIHFTLTNNPGKEYDAKIYAISNTFETNSKAIAIHAMVEGNKQGLIDGMSITAIVSLEKAMLDAVPSEALVNYQGTDFIFIVAANQSDSTQQQETTAIHQHDENGHSHPNDNKTTASETVFEKIPVRKGTSDVGYTEITPLKDIPADARIVTKGAFFILAKMTNTGEHEH
ncbi:MAG: efflux RND transporter periplasmic adaptor subunit [Bacteroidetes bacterium]|jgi:RND family efflux transporter MFP subunit|nr:efflux RND transporter periplasmic adaptor subunit [Bacteroidota bacterium]